MVGWEIKKLSEILHESKIPSEKPDPSKRISVRLHQKGVEKRDLVNDKKGATRYYIRKKNQFIYGKQNIQRGAFGIIPEELDNFESSSDLPSFDVSDICLPEWIMEWLNLGKRYQELGKIARGAGSQRVSPKEFLSLSIPVPSIETQRKIIGHIFSVRTLNNDLWCEINHQHMLLKQLRQAVLQEAIEGKLTAEWRKENPELISGENSGKKLLERIKTEKEKLTKEGKIKKQKLLPPTKEEEKPFELPEGWCWCRLGEVGIFERGKSKHRPRNAPFLFKKGIYPFVQTGDVSQSKKNKNIIKSYDKKYNELGLRQSKLWPKGTLCITIAANIAETGILGLEACFPDSIVGFITMTDANTTEYIRIFFELSQQNIINFAPATAQRNINLGIIWNLSFPLPPLPEQQAIVHRVDKIMAVIDDMEKQINERKDQAEHLMQSVLREAFEEDS